MWILRLKGSYVCSNVFFAGLIFGETWGDLIILGVLIIRGMFALQRGWASH